MSIMIDMPPAVVQQVQAYAESRGLTISCLLRNYLADLVKTKGRARLMGAAAEYANPKLRASEKGAFARAMEKEEGLNAIGYRRTL